MDQQPSSPQTPLSARTFIITGIVIVVIGAAIYFFRGSPSSVKSVNVTGEQGYTYTQTPPGTYKDGTYTADGEYRSPAGPETVGITLTLKDGRIADANAVVEATMKKSMMMQQIFVDNFKPLVVGKTIDEVHLTKVSGSSLTPTGFNSAVEKIRIQAHT